MMNAPLSWNSASSRSPCSRWACFLVGEEAARAVLFPDERAIEADQVIDAKPVEQLGAAPRPLPEPFVAAGLVHVPAIHGQPPVLAGLRERVRGNADRRVDAELVLAGPDVGAVAAHHEGEVAEDHDAGVAGAPGATARRRSTAASRNRGSRAPASSRAAASASGRRSRSGASHSSQVLAVVLRVERPEERVVLDPPAFAVDERAERRGPRRAAASTRRARSRSKSVRSTPVFSSRTARCCTAVAPRTSASCSRSSGVRPASPPAASNSGIA